MHPKSAEGITNSVDPDQTAPLGQENIFFDGIFSEINYEEMNNERASLIHVKRIINWIYF